MQDIFDLFDPIFCNPDFEEEKFHNCQQCIWSNLSNNCIAVTTAVVFLSSIQLNYLVFSGFLCYCVNNFVLEECIPSVKEGFLICSSDN